jgi:hypothetical protein
MITVALSQLSLALLRLRGQSFLKCRIEFDARLSPRAGITRCRITVGYAYVLKAPGRAIWPYLIEALKRWLREFVWRLRPRARVRTILLWGKAVRRLEMRRRELDEHRFLVEARGFEPRSETRSTTASTCVFH